METITDDSFLLGLLNTPSASFFPLPFLSLSSQVELPMLCSQIEFHAHLAQDTFGTDRSDPPGAAQQPYAWAQKDAEIGFFVSSIFSGSFNI